MKYVDNDGEVRTLVAKKQKNYFTDPLLYAESTEVAPPLKNEYDSGNEANTELKAVTVKYKYEPHVISLECLDVKDIADKQASS